MAKKTKKSAENIAAQTAAPAVETTPTVTPTAQQGETPRRANLIVAQRKFDRWYVYFKGVAPKDNVGCGCKTAKSAIRYMHLLKARYGATISQTIYERLQFEAARLCQNRRSLPFLPSSIARRSNMSRRQSRTRRNTIG